MGEFDSPGMFLAFFLLRTVVMNNNLGPHDPLSPGEGFAKFCMEEKFMSKGALFWVIIAALFGVYAGESKLCATAARKYAISVARQCKGKVGATALSREEHLDSACGGCAEEPAVQGLGGKRSRRLVAAPCQRLSGGGEAPIAGLINLGNTCYFNSVIQSLVHCSPLRHAVIEGEVGMQAGLGNVTQFLVELLRKMWDGNAGSRYGHYPFILVLPSRQILEIAVNLLTTDVTCVVQETGDAFGPLAGSLRG